MTYEEAMDYIQTVSKKGSILGLDTTRELLRRVGDPQDSLRFVHIAGTNGKGSALAYISEILMAAGYRVGRYISPVIIEYAEKIQVNGCYIPEASIAKHMTALRAAAEAMAADGMPQPTIFEMETAMAFLQFAEEACDIVVLETGMGGQDDSTNVIAAPLVSVIMSVSLDHVGVIGNNLAEIARCKAGIIKEGSHTVLYAQSKEVTDIIEEVCAAQHNQLVTTRPEELVIRKTDIHGQDFDYGALKDIHTGLLGEHQLKNAEAAIEAAYMLREQGYALSDDAIREGIAHTCWPGRFELVSEQPLIIIDGAHNPDGARSFCSCVETYLKDYEIVLVMGVLRDKDYPQIIKLTNTLARAIITIDPDNARALSDVELKEKIDELKEKDIPVQAAGRIEEGMTCALSLAEELKGQTDKPVAVAVFGSLSFQGDLRRYLDRL